MNVFFSETKLPLTHTKACHLTKSGLKSIDFVIKIFNEIIRD